MKHGLRILKCSKEIERQISDIICKTSVVVLSTESVTRQRNVHMNGCLWKFICRDSWYFWVSVYFSIVWVWLDEGGFHFKRSESGITNRLSAIGDCFLLLIFVLGKVLYLISSIYTNGKERKNNAIPRLTSHILVPKILRVRCDSF